MKSRLPKALHPVLGEPMIHHILRAVARTGIPPERTLVVVGFAGDKVRQTVSAQGPYLFAEQTAQLGTGHALLSAQAALQSLTVPADHLLLVYGDNPLLTPQTLQKLLNTHLEIGPLVTLATSFVDDPTGYGRIVREAATGRFRAIVEEVDLLPEQKLIKEFNPGVYVFNGRWVWPALARLKKSPRGEYYLTDLPGFATEVVAPPTASPAVELVTVEAEDVLGINDRVQLAQVGDVFRYRVLRAHMLAGVTIVDPASTYISAESEIGQDTIIEPNTHLRGKCKIGQDCRIGPNSLLENAQVGHNCQVLASVIQDSALEDEVSIGPMSRIRPGSYLERGVYMGNFAEVSRSRIGRGSKQSHFSFLGDTTTGPNVNVGAGTITANYDGVNKNKTVIGARVFIGSDTILRAPVKLGDDARTGAGAVVTKDVEPGTTVVGVPARPYERKAAQPTTEPTQEPAPVPVQEPVRGETNGVPNP
jgi:bifunctional UDP-N-acetylglucosamine pyrophosphorylase/glucosamine-1-phosphate N-acetyltransferase